MESIRKIAARGSGRWSYRLYDVELATRTTTWSDASGARSRSLIRYELRVIDRGVGYRYFSTNAERRAFIGRSFSDLVLRDLDPPQRDTVAHPLAPLVGQR